MASKNANLVDIEVYHSSDSMDSMACDIELGPALIIIAQLLNSVPCHSSIPCLSTKFVFSLLFLEPFGSCYTGSRLFSRLLSLVFCAAVANDCLSVVGIGSGSCSDSDLLLFSQSVPDSEGLCSLS